MNARIGVLVVAYNAATTLAQTIERIPRSLMDRLEEVFIFDDHSTDDTYERMKAYLAEYPMPKVKLFRNPKNLGYGGNQKRGYRYAIDQGLDFVVLLHGDGQYKPEVMEQLLEPCERGEADMVMGSRMMPGGHPLKGGMPLYKFFGNKLVTFLENRIIGMNLWEFHSGYRVYSCAALKQVPFELCSDNFHFDTEIIIQFHERGLRIAERPIPTYYGGEICYVNGFTYCYHCLESALTYRFHRLNWRKNPKFELAR